MSLLQLVWSRKELTTSNPFDVWWGRIFDTQWGQIIVAAAASSAMGLISLAFPSPVVVLAMPMALLGLLFAINLPYFVCLTFLTMTYFKLPDISQVLQPLNHVLSALSALVSVSLIWHGVLTRAVPPYKHFRPNKIHILLWVFWGLITFNVLLAQAHSYADEGIRSTKCLTTLKYTTFCWSDFAQAPSQAAKGWSDFSKILFLSLAIPLFFRRETQLLTGFRFFVLGGAITSFSSFFHYYSGEDLVEGTRAGAGDGLLSNPNDLAIILLLPLAFAGAGFFMKSHVLERIWNLGAAGIMITAIVYTQSRGGLLGVVTVLALIGARVMKSKVVPISCALIVGLFIYGAADISGRVSGGDQDVKGQSAQDRIYAWRAGTNMALDYPVTGVGIGNFVAMFPTYTPVGTLHPLTAHSIWFLVLGENGFPGFLTFVAMVILGFTTNLTSSRLLALSGSAELRSFAIGLVAGLGGFCVAGTFLSFSYQWPLYIILAWTISLARIANSNVHSNSANLRDG